MVVFRIFIPIWSRRAEFVAFSFSEECLARKTNYYRPYDVQVRFIYWIVIRLFFIKYQRWSRVPLRVYVTKNGLSLGDLMSMDRFSVYWMVVGFLLVGGEGGVVKVSLCRSFSNDWTCVWRYALPSSTYVWYLVRLIDLGGCGWKWVALCTSIYSWFFKGEIIWLCS